MIALVACGGGDAPASLFNGKDLSGWHVYNEGDVVSVWTVENGLLTCDPWRDAVFGDLVTDEQFENFDFSCEWRIDSGANSGLFFHVEESATIPTPWMSGFEYQLLDNDDTLNHNYGDPTRMSGAFYGFYDLPDSVLYFPRGQWNKTRVIVDHGTVTYYLNGLETARVDLNSDQWKQKVEESKFKDYPQFGIPRAGRIGLQSWRGRVQFKNMSIRNL